MRKQTNKKRNHVLNSEERALERALERGEYVSVPHRAREIQRAQRIARNTFTKTKTINIRLSERDLVRLRARANRDGVPYQTLVASFIRRAVG